MNRVDRCLKNLSHLTAIEGQNGSGTTFHAVDICRQGFLLSVDETYHVLERWNATNCQPPWNEHQLWHKINSYDPARSNKEPGYELNGEEAKSQSHQAPAPMAKKPRLELPKKWIDGKIIHLIENEAITVQELKEMSPQPIEEINLDTFGVIKPLFRGNDFYICLASDFYTFHTKRVSEWEKDLADNPRNIEFFCPNPFTSPRGVTREGKPSPRTLTNVCKDRWMIVVETDLKRDTAPEIFRAADAKNLNGLDIAATVLAHLAKRAPMELCVFSGSKSIHAFFPCRGIPKRQQFEFFSRAVELSADPALKSKVQLVRAPLGLRNGDPTKLQRIVYRNPYLQHI